MPVGLQPIDLRIQPGEPFLREKVSAGIEAVLSRYDAAGYGLANVMPIVGLHTEDHTVDLKFEVERGERDKIASIDVNGASPAQEAQIRQMLTLHKEKKPEKCGFALSRRELWISSQTHVPRRNSLVPHFIAPSEAGGRCHSHLAGGLLRVARGHH